MRNQRRRRKDILWKVTKQKVIKKVMELDFEEKEIVEIKNECYFVLIKLDTIKRHLRSIKHKGIIIQLTLILKK